MCQRVSWSMNAVPYIIIHCPANKWKHLGIAFNHLCPRSTTYTTTEPVQRQTFYHKTSRKWNDLVAHLSL